MNTTKPITQLIEDMLSERDCRPDTISTYRRKLRIWVNWSVQNDCINNPTAKSLAEYKTHLIDSGRQPDTVNGYMAVIKILFRWMSENGYCKDITKGIKWRTEASSSVKGFLTTDQVVRLLNAMPKTTDIEIRNYAIVNLMLRIGARCIEVVRLDRSDITFIDNKYQIKLQRKGRISKSSNIQISKTIYLPIESYMALKFFAPITDPVFQSEGSLPGRRLTTKTIGRIAQDAMRLIGIEGKEYTAHSFRHTAAIVAYLQHVPIGYIQQMLGHKTITTTEGYLRSLQQENIEATKAFIAIENAYQMCLNVD